MIHSNYLTSFFSKGTDTLDKHFKADVYFDRRLGAEHLKGWLKYAFHVFFMKAPLHEIMKEIKLN